MSKKIRVGIMSTGEIPDLSIRAHWQFSAGEQARKMINLTLRSIFVHTSKGSLTCRKSIRQGVDGFTSPSKEGVLRIFNALKNPSSSARFEPAYLGSNGKNANHYTIEEDFVGLVYMISSSIKSRSRK
jgi:hypothetical protein